MDPRVNELLQRGTVIPACPLALNSERQFDERRQRALVRYYLASSAGGLAVGVHTTQFAIREHNLYGPVLELVVSELNRATRPVIKIAGVCGDTKQAVIEASIACELGYDAALLSLGAWRDSSEDELISHCQTIAETIPVVGFYLQPSAGGRLLPFSFWRRFAEIQNIVAIKIAPFNRYQTIDVIRAVA
ncbi:MAG: dihydrodipicolinate synthase family protein, partial [Limisphaerales bacterium]